MDGDPQSVTATLTQLMTGVTRLGVRLTGADVVELGSGRTPEVALAFAAAGARSVRGFDIVKQVPERWPARAGVARELIETIGVSQQPPLDDAEIGRRVAFSDYDGQHLPLADGSVDLVVSKSVLEHVAPELVVVLVDDMYRVLRHGGVAVHVVDLRDHMFISGDDVDGDWLDALRYPEPLFRAMFSRRSTAINRLRLGEWRAVFERAGFTLEHSELRRYPLHASFERARLQPRWRMVPDDELSVGQVLLAVRRGDAA